MFKIYKAKVTQFGPSAVVITTSFKNAGGYFKGESFVVLPAPHQEKSFRAIRFEEKTFNETSVELNEAFVLDELLNQARMDIGLHIQNHYGEKPFLVPTGELQITETDLAFLVHMQVRGEAKFLFEIIDGTDCTELSDALAPITALQQVSHRKMS